MPILIENLSVKSEIIPAKRATNVFLQESFLFNQLIQF